MEHKYNQSKWREPALWPAWKSRQLWQFRPEGHFWKNALWHYQQLFLNRSGKNHLWSKYLELRQYKKVWTEHKNRLVLRLSRFLHTGEWKARQFQNQVSTLANWFVWSWVAGGQIAMLYNKDSRFLLRLRCIALLHSIFTNLLRRISAVANW